MVLQPRKKTSVEAGWIIFAVIFSTFSSALIILLCWWTTRGSSKKSSSSTEQEQQQQNESSSRQLTSRRSVRYWYYYPEYFGHNNGGSSEPPSDDYDASYTGTEYHLEQQQQHPDYYIYPPPPYPPCPDPPPPPPRPPRTPPHIAVYRTRPVNVMSFLVRNQRKREPPPPPVAEVTSPERTSTPTPEDGSSSSSGSSPDEPPPNGDGPPPHGPRGDPSGGPRPEGSAPDPPDPIIIDVDSPKSNGLAPDSPDPHIVDVQSPKSNGSVISRQDVSEAQANFGKLMSEAGTTSERSAPSQAGSKQSTSVNLGHRTMSRASKASIRESVADDAKRAQSSRPDSHKQCSAAGSEVGSHRQGPKRSISGVRYVKAPTYASSKERRGSKVASPKGSSKEGRRSKVASSHGHTASPSTSSLAIRSASPPSAKNPRTRSSQASRHPSIPSRHSRPSPLPRLSLSPPRSHASHRSRRSSPPQSPTSPHHSPIQRSPSRHSRSYSHSQTYSRPASRRSNPPRSPIPPHHSPSRSGNRYNQSHSHYDDRPASRHSSISRPRSRVSSMPPSPTVTDFASISEISHPPGSPSHRSSRSPAYGSGGYGVALSPQQQQKEHERKGSRQSTYSRHSGAKSPSAVSVSVVELLSLEKDVDQTGQGGGMSLLEHEEQEDPDEREDDEIVVLDEEGRLLSRRSVSNSRASSHRQIDPTDHQRDFMEMEHGQHQHDDQIRESPVLQPEPGPEPETEQVPEDYYRSYSPVVLAVGNPEPLLPSSPNLSAHSSNLSPRSPYHPGKYIPAPTQVPKENRPHQASVCSVSDSPDSGIGGVGDGKGKSE
ncbi:hypothetical protein SMAC4_01144 [Sordaria macrospora]|uniref:uncharacterized protein n=1 Tax=Sordaria macrospora TaxID=5147 RepID=UPI002B313A38|nr:hypothetical protein SMAC4_01144 [Sordaria macrospora]